MQKITTFLWFDREAEEAANFYVSIFKNSKITNVIRYGEAGPLPAGTVSVVSFQLEGLEYMAMNAGPHFRFNEAISLFVDCKSQEEVDELWSKLCEGGEPSQCGWLKDKYGLSWQIVPSILMEMIQDKDAEKVKRVTEALYQMSKIDIQALREAYERE
jgi:predicted 3-demethylubiquinone-9 3-methyltransferase (glyoxalase superfamily)